MFRLSFLFRFQSPPKGATIPYRPKPQINTPVLLANGQAYTIQGSYVPTQEVCNTISLNIFFVVRHCSDFFFRYSITFIFHSNSIVFYLKTFYLDDR